MVGPSGEWCGWVRCDQRAVVEAVELLVLVLLVPPGQADGLGVEEERALPERNMLLLTTTLYCLCLVLSPVYT